MAAEAHGTREHKRQHQEGHGRRDDAEVELWRQSAGELLVGKRGRAHEQRGDGRSHQDAAGKEHLQRAERDCDDPPVPEQDFVEELW